MFVFLDLRLIHKFDWAQNLWIPWKHICLGVCRISFRSEFIWFSFTYKNRYSCCWNQHLFATQFWINSNISKSWDHWFADMILVWALSLSRLKWSAQIQFLVTNFDRLPFTPPMVASPVIQLVSDPIKDFSSLIGSKSMKATLNVVSASHRSSTGPTNHTGRFTCLRFPNYWVSSLENLARCCVQCCKWTNHSNSSGVSWFEQ
jgi:hypothetical protein